MPALKLVAENERPAIEPLSVLAVQMPKDLAERVQRLAAENDRPVSAEIRKALRAHVEREAPEP